MLGDHGAGLLAEAIRDHGLPGDVYAIPDDLGHGPLDDGAARIAYFRRCYEGVDDWRHSEPDAFRAWNELHGPIAGWSASTW